MKTKEQLQAEIIEKQKELIEVLKNHCTMSYVCHCTDYIKVESELSALTTALEKEGEEISSSSAKNYDPEDE